MVEAEPELRDRIDGMLLAAVGVPTKPPKPKKRSRRRQVQKVDKSAAAGDPDDTLEDLFIGGLA